SEPANRFQYRRAIEQHIPRDFRTEHEGRRGEDRRTYSDQCSIRIPTQPLPLPARRATSADPAHHARKRVPTDTRRRASRPTEDTRGRGEARSAWIRQHAKPP